MSKYAWTITKDSDNDEAVGTIGPNDATPEQVTSLNEGNGETFKMFDDDGELYYTGKIIGDYDGFEPLDDFGTPNAGATEIKYKNKEGKWETL